MPLEQPQARVSVGGQYIDGLLEIDIQSCSAFMAGRFLVQFSVGFFLSIDEFISFDGSSLSIEIADNSFSYKEVMKGYVENIQFDLLEKTVTLQGRDFTSILIDANLDQSFVNQSASDIAVEIAKKYGMTANVCGTSSLVGQYYQIDHTKIGLNIGSKTGTTWDLLCKIAVPEDCIVFVTNDTLNFTKINFNVHEYLYPSDFMSLDVDIISALPDAVQVKSWNSREKSVVDQSIGNGSTLKIVKPNLTIDKAYKYASSYMNLIQQQKKIITGQMPGDTSLKTMTSVMVSGTGSSLDGLYFVDSLRRRINSREGFVQFMRASAVSS